MKINKMKNVKEFLLGFLQAENDAINLERRPNLEAYNQAVRHMYSFTVKLLFEGLGIVLYHKPESESYYERVKNIPKNNPGQLFKLAHYQHDKWEDVWVGYVSSSTSREKKVLDIAYFIIPDNGNYLIARRYIYTDFDSDGLKMEWSPSEGYSELTFESLGKLVNTERYAEPDDVFDSIQLYNEDG